MALSVSRDKHKIPEGAIALSEADAIKLQRDTVEKWKPASDIWALKYGGAILCGLTTIVAIRAHGHYRVKLKLKNIGKTVSLVCLLPCAISATFMLHTQLITENILLFKNQCNLCTEIKGAALQVMTGVVSPVLGAQLLSFSLADVAGTFNIPYKKTFTSVVELSWKFTKPFLPTLAIMFAVNAFAGNYITYKEIKHTERMMGILRVREEQSNMRRAEVQNMV